MALALKNIFMWNVVISIFPIVAAINTPFSDVIFSLIIIWIFFLAFMLGFISKSAYPKVNFDNATCRVVSNKIIFTFILFSFLLSLYASYFYTGNTPVKIIASFAGGGSLYNDYQDYFKDNSIGVFSFTKLPAIFSLFIIKLVLFYSFFLILCKKSTLSRIDYFLIIASLFPSLYFSISRGTSFEIFNILILSWFVLLVRSKRFDFKINLFSKTIVYSAIILLLVMAIYSFNVSARYSFESTFHCTSSEVCFEPNSVLGMLFPGFAYFTSQMAGYFTFGLVYTSRFFYEVFFFDSTSATLSLLPVGYLSDLEPTYLCGRTIDCGANWIPDIIRLIYYNGFIVLFLLVFILGGVLCKSFDKCHKNNYKFADFIIAFYSFYFFISLHVGNFITAASDNQLMIFFAIFLKIFNFINLRVNDVHYI